MPGSACSLHLRPLVSPHGGVVDAAARAHGEGVKPWAALFFALPHRLSLHVEPFQVQCTGLGMLGVQMWESPVSGQTEQPCREGTASQLGTAVRTGCDRGWEQGWEPRETSCRMWWLRCLRAEETSEVIRGRDSTLGSGKGELLGTC